MTSRTFAFTWSSLQVNLGPSGSIHNLWSATNESSSATWTHKRHVDEPDTTFPRGGVSVEYFQMLSNLYDKKGANHKIVPVYFLESERLEVVPQALQHYTWHIAMGWICLPRVRK
jgi:hypothetical protein